EDAKTGPPVHSLSGATRRPLPAQLAGIDALVFDIQDVGCRFYTYVSTMGMAMEEAAKHGKEFIVLDRVNPINGVTVEGPVLAEPPTFVGYFRVPLRHGMTAGELAKMHNAEKNLGVKLTVVPLENWWRGLWLDQTGLPWSNPSPNLRNMKQAALYPGIGLSCWQEPGDPVRLIRQITALRGHGAPGFTVFNYDRHAEAALPFLPLGVTAP
ncbi:MAG: DUF1343 domain-containing protein, partial [Kiritimatiellaeota bacterium]|nr:DUF1343 domain-containing protein [Kiritimatiellota bacterium]